MSARTHKRSWKNYLIYRGYQIRLTAFMVTLVGLVLGGLGYWVHKSTRQSTTVAILSAQGMCPTPSAPPAPPAPPVPPVAAGEALDPEAPTPPRAGDAEVRSQVVLTESSIEVVEATPAASPMVAAVITPAQHRACLGRQAALIAELRAGQRNILLALVGAGVLLLVLMAGYSIVMTHKVAGPLFKLTGHLRKWGAGTYEKIWGLRKGDELVALFEHFRAAHRRVIDDQKRDLEFARQLAAASTDAAIRQDVDALIAAQEGALKDV